MSTFRFEDPQRAPVSRATWAACQARIAELEAENATLKRHWQVAMDTAPTMTERHKRCEARLAAVIALCDERWNDDLQGYMYDVRAAATGDPQ